MSMSRAPWIQFTVLAALIAVVILAGWGIFLTTTQGREIEMVLLHAAKLGAERRVRGIEDELARAESAALAEIERLAGSDLSSAALEALRQRHPLVETPFLLGRDFTFLYPPLAGDEPGPSPLLRDEPIPEELLMALRLVARGAPAGESRQALEAIHQAAEMASTWRFRALAALASLELRAGDAPAASRTYDRLFDEFRDELDRKSTRPSRLHLVIAHARALRESGQDERALSLVADALGDLVDGSLRPETIGEERFFARAAERLVESLGSDGVHAGSAGLGELLSAHRRRLELRQSTGSPDLWRTIAARIRVAAASSASPVPARLVEGGPTARRIVVWRPAPGADGDGGLTAIGFLTPPGAVRDFVGGLLTPSDGDDSDFVFRVLDDADTDGAPIAALPGELGFLRIGLEEEPWRRRLRVARRPYRVAGVLIPALGAGMILALVMFWVGYRRERFLSKMKTDFVANVSHELKTPLALIRLFGETLSLDRVPDDARRREYYEIITRESERLTHLINNVLDFASIEANRKSYDLVPTDIGRVVADTVKTYQFHLEEKSFRLETEIAGDLPSCLADADAVAQALINLINNAVKYSTDRKEITVRVRSDGGWVRIEVSDRGVGIPPEDLRRIFEDFYRSKAARSLARRGTGLGLAVVQHIMRSHGGRVEVRSEPGEGSTFTLALPARTGGTERAGTGGTEQSGTRRSGGHGG